MKKYYLNKGLFKGFLSGVIIMIAMCACSDNRCLYRIQADGQYGFIDSVGNVVIPPQYKYVSNFTKGGFAYFIDKLEISGDTSFLVYYGYINKANEVVNSPKNVINIPIKKEDLEGFKETVQFFENGNFRFNDNYLSLLTLSSDRYVYQDPDTKLWGYKNSKGEIIIDAKYIEASQFKNNRAVVRDTFQLDLEKDLNSYGVINTEGKQIVPCEYSYIENYGRDGKTWAAKVYVKEKGKELDFQKEYVQLDMKGNILGGPIPVFGVDGRIYNNPNNNIYIMSWKDIIGSGYALVDKNGKYLTDWNNDGMLYMSFSGKEKNEVESFVTNYSEGCIGVVRYNQQDERAWFFADKKFEIVSEPYDSLLSFTEGLAAVKELKEIDGKISHLGKWGFVNKEFNMEIDYEYDEIGPFVRGLAYFCNKGESFDIEGFINKKGNVVWQNKRIISKE